MGESTYYIVSKMTTSMKIILSMIYFSKVHETHINNKFKDYEKQKTLSSNQTVAKISSTGLEDREERVCS